MTLLSISLNILRCILYCAIIFIVNHWSSNQPLTYILWTWTPYIECIFHNIENKNICLKKQENERYVFLFLSVKVVCGSCGGVLVVAGEESCGCAVEWKSYSLTTELYQVSTWDTSQVQPKIMEILTCRVLFYGLVQT